MLAAIWSTVVFLGVVVIFFAGAQALGFFDLGHRVIKAVVDRLTFQPFEAEARGLPCTFSVVSGLFMGWLTALAVVCVYLFITGYAIFWPWVWMVEAWKAL